MNTTGPASALQRHFQHLAIGCGLITGVGARKNKQLPTARALLQVGAQLFHEPVIRCHGDYRHIIINQRQGPCFNSPRGKPRHGYRNLLELEGPSMAMG